MCVVCVCVCCVCVGIASVKKLSTCFQLVVSAATFLNLKQDIENVCMIWSSSIVYSCSVEVMLDGILLWDDRLAGPCMG